MDVLVDFAFTMRIRRIRIVTCPAAIGGIQAIGVSVLLFIVSSSQ